MSIKKTEQNFGQSIDVAVTTLPTHVAKTSELMHIKYGLKLGIFMEEADSTVPQPIPLPHDVRGNFRIEFRKRISTFHFTGC